MPKRRIQHFVWGLPRGGAETVLLNVVSRTRDTLDHRITCLGPDIDPNFIGEFKLEDKTVQAHRFLWSFLKLPQIRNEIMDFSPQIIHTYGWAGTDALIASLGVKNLKRCHSEHGLGLIDKTGWRKCYLELFLKKVDRFVSVSGMIATALEKRFHVPSRKIISIPNGVDTAKFTIAPHYAERERFGLNEKDFVLGFVGGLRAVKNPVFLLEALKTARKKIPTLKLMVIGDGELMPGMRAYSSQNNLDDSVLFFGKRDDLERLYPLMDCFVLSSHSEQCPMTVLEAMACGLPVVTPKVGDIENIVAPKNQNLLFESGSTKDFIQKIEWIRANSSEVKEIGQLNREKVENNYSLDRMVNAYKNLYERLIQETK